MNNFTKEELMQIADAIIYSGLFESRKDRLIPIRAKIMMMIDNYCEHDGEIGKDYPAEKCMKCGKYWE